VTVFGPQCIDSRVSNSNKQKLCMSALNMRDSRSKNTCKLQSYGLWRRSTRRCSNRDINGLPLSASAAVARNVWRPKTPSKVCQFAENVGLRTEAILHIAIVSSRLRFHGARSVNFRKKVE